MIRYRSEVLDSERWQSFSARAGDIIIRSPPKSGTTWMQVICALLIFQRTTLEQSLDLISPRIEMETREISDVIADLDDQQLRRFIKSHTPLDGRRQAGVGTPPESVDLVVVAPAKMVR